MEQNKILIKQAKIIDPLSSHKGDRVDILIKDDIIQKIAANIEDPEARSFSSENLCVSPGWFDLRANFCDPGFEEKEDIESGVNAAIFGGFTGVAISPDTKPTLDSKALVEYIYKKAEGLPINVYPYGALTKKLEGKELSEMYDMFEAGAIAFSHGKTSPDNLAVIKVALQYQKNFAPPLHLFAMNESLMSGGQMHEGEKSTYLGLKGIPAMAEEIGLHNALHLAEYAETPIHFNGISTSSGINILEQAQKDGKAYSADVALANVFFTDEDLETYDTRYKVMPPLRTKSDRDSIIKALKDDVIHAIASDHYPENIENKMCEFDHAAFGIISLESFVGAVGKALSDELGWERIIELIAINPRRILGLQIPTIEEGNMAELSFFNPEKEWTFSKKDIQSKSTNSPFIGKTLKGKALGIFNEGVMVWLDT